MSTHSLEAMPSSSPTFSPDLPAPILLAVLRHLPSHADRVRFAAACRHWRAAATRQPTEEPPLPWIALPDGTFLSFPNSHAFPFPNAAAATRYHGSCEDWLIFDRDGDNVGDGYLLVNPFSGATMELPSLSSVRHVAQDPVKGTTLFTVDIKGDRRAPAITTVRKLIITQPDQFVVAIIGDGTRGKIAACRGDGAEFWTIRAHEQWRGFRDVAFHEGSVYAVNDNGDLCVVGVGEDPYFGEPVLSVGKRVVKMPANGSPVPVARHLVVTGGRLVMVTRVAGESAFKVFETDRTSSEWKEVSSVGKDTVLFIGRWSSVARSVAKYEMPGNMIYFLDDDRICDTTFGGYNITDGKAYYDLVPSPALRSDGGTPATWLFSRVEYPSRGMSDHPMDILCQTMRCLTRGDQLSLRQVCRVLRAAVHHHWPPKPPPHAPAYLARPDGAVFRYPALTCLRFSDAADYRGVACDGWLLYRDGGDDRGLLRLTSPFTGRTRLLPGLLDLRVAHDPVHLDPELGRGSSWTHDDGEAMAVQKMVVLRDSNVVAALLGRDRLSMLALCSPDAASKWTVSARDGCRKYDDMAVCGGRLYAVTNAEDLVAFDIVVPGETDGPRISRVELAIMGGYAAQRYGPDVAVARYLVASGNSSSNTMFMVRRPLTLRDGEAPRLAVFRADLAAMQWVEVSTLGYDGNGEGMALFVGRLCSRTVPARGHGRINAVREDEVLFLPDDSPSAGSSSYFFHRVSVYDMRDGKVWDVDELKIWREAPAPATWIFPEAD